jgi:hypothetical protein
MVCCSSSLLTWLSTNASNYCFCYVTLRLPSDTLDTPVSTSEDVGDDTDELGSGLRAARCLIAKEVMLWLLAELTSGVATAGVALACSPTDTTPLMLFVTLGFLLRLFSEVAVLGRLAVGTAGNVGRAGYEVGVFCVFSTLFFFDSRCGVLDMIRIDRRAARGNRGWFRILQ